jgi:hypothetical protein
MQTCDLKTAIVYNSGLSKQMGLPPFYYRWRNCDTNLTSNTPANQYQRLKQIQNTIRVPTSLYTSNLGPLNAYKQPQAATYGVCWNQMSDRPVPSVQRATIPTGSNNSMNRRHTSVTSSKPGSQTPGGIGCDIKHNSYDRYLNRLKGKGPLRRGVVPPNFGTPIPFNPAFPIYGGKTMKTNIVTGCNCPIGTNLDPQIYNDPLWQPALAGACGFQEGAYVYAQITDSKAYSKAIITAVVVENSLYDVSFVNVAYGTRENVPQNELIPYFPCNCNSSYDDITFKNISFNNITGIYGIDCSIATEVFL